MVGIRGESVAQDLAENLSASLRRMAQGFQDQDCCAFTHHKAVPLCVERTAGTLRIVVVGRQGTKPSQGGEGQRRLGGL